MADEPKTVIVEGLGGINPVKMVETIAAMGQDIKHIKMTVDELKKRSEKQDEIINQLRSNCNREERWQNLSTDVRILKSQIADILSAKCPKTPRFNDIEATLVTITSNVENISDLLNTHIEQHKTAKEATKPYHDFIIEIGKYVICAVAGMVLLAMWLHAGLPA